MNREDIISMALKANLIYDETITSPWVEGTNLTLYLERFAALVASAEREACAKIAESKRHSPNFSLTSMPPQNGTAVDIANAIRARGQA